MTKTTRKTIRSRTIAASLLGLMISACAIPAPQIDPTVFDKRTTAEMLSAAYEGIQTFHIDEPNVPDVATSGLEGLSEIDDRYSVSREDGTVSVTYDDIQLASFPEPDADDVPRWSMLSAAAIDVGRIASQDLEEATPEEIYDTVLSAAIGQLDRFSRYASAKKAKENRAQRQGYSGIGVSLGLVEGRPVITGVFIGSPAAEAGLVEGDILLEVDGTRVDTLTTHAIADLVRGPTGTAVRLRIASGETGAVHALSVDRRKVIEQTVYAKRLGTIAHIRVTGFNERTEDDMRRALARARSAQRPLEGVILDLRGNRGGVLPDAIALSNLFVEDGTLLKMHGRHAMARKRYDADLGDTIDGRPMAVLIDSGSASASEVVASALQDAGRAVVIGSRSYGKGTVQMIRPLPNKGELILTWARMYAPSGYALSTYGVMPDICTFDGGSVDAVLSDLSDPDSADALARELRLSVGSLPATERAALLQACPDTPRRKYGTDLPLEVARTLLDDPMLYTSAFRTPSVAMRP